MSDSSEEPDGVNSSDELINSDHNLENNVDMIDQFITEDWRQSENRPQGGETNRPRNKRRVDESKSMREDDQPGPSRVNNRTDTLVREAENGKVRIYQTPGKNNQLLSPNIHLHTALVDEDYMILAAHVDEATRQKKGNMWTF